MTDRDPQGRRRGVQLFDVPGAPLVEETAAQRPPTFDDAARAALPTFAEGRGSVTKLLFGDPDGVDDGGMSLIWARFGANFRLPRHSHNVDCLYYVVAGEIRMGNRTLAAGHGFFVPANAPYTYVVGPAGVELLEFRSVSAYDSTNVESAEGWRQILDAVAANKDGWAEELAPYRVARAEGG